MPSAGPIFVERNQRLTLSSNHSVSRQFQKRHSLRNLTIICCYLECGRPATMRHAIFTYIPLTTLRQDLDCPGSGRTFRRRRDRILFFVGAYRFEFNSSAPAGGGPVGIGRPSWRRHCGRPTWLGSGRTRGQRRVGVDSSARSHAVLLLAPALGRQVLRGGRGRKGPGQV